MKNMLRRCIALVLAAAILLAASGLAETISEEEWNAIIEEEAESLAGTSGPSDDGVPFLLADRLREA